MAFLVLGTAFLVLGTAFFGSGDSVFCGKAFSEASSLQILAYIMLVACSCPKGAQPHPCICFCLLAVG